MCWHLEMAAGRELGTRPIILLDWLLQFKVGIALGVWVAVVSVMTCTGSCVNLKIVSAEG